jgi:hypothetical protein
MHMNWRCLRLVYSVACFLHKTIPQSYQKGSTPLFVHVPSQEPNLVLEPHLTNEPPPN